MNSSRREFIKRIALVAGSLRTPGSLNMRKCQHPSAASHDLAKSAVFSMKENSIATLAWN